MNTEETELEMKEPENQVSDLKDPKDPDQQAAADPDATEADVSQADLDQEEQEKQPMTGAPCAGEQEEEKEKNGSVKVKILEETEEKFTGLNKEELLRVAGTPGWIRTRWALLFVFWLGWLGMLVGAVLIILQAPGCRELPPTNWWNHGPLYQIGKVQVFTDLHNLRGVEQKMNSLSQLKVKGLVLGPIHVAPRDDAMGLRFEEISPEAGNLEQFKGFIHAAHKNGISVVLDLTPNYLGLSGPWFSSSSVTNVAERLKSALVFWLNEGVDGIQLSAVEDVANMVPSLWADIRAIVQNRTDKNPSARVLIGVTKSSSAQNVSDLLSYTGVDLLISNVLTYGKNYTTNYAEAIQDLYSSHSQTKLAWSLGGRAEGHLASLVSRAQVKLHQLLLLTLPGTPVFNYGDEIGLMDEATKFPKMLWDPEKELNGTLQAQSDAEQSERVLTSFNSLISFKEPAEEHSEEQSERLSYRSFFCSASELRSKALSLLHGDWVLLFNSSSSLVYLRVWDQSDRYLAAFNWAEEEVVFQLSGSVVPRHGAVVLSTNSSALPEDGSVDLNNLQLGPGQAALIKLPSSG